jgi:hypothetical protein
MIQSGKSVTAKDDPLSKIQVEYFFNKLKNPDAEISSKVRQLRIIRQLDSKQYSFLKRQLPYIVCGIFNPSFRRTENFAYTEYFMVDIDHIAEKELSVNDLRQRLVADSRVVLCFLSPGEDGLKVMFRLKERCYDAGIYSVFYKLFVITFAKQYGLEQVIDARTSDVARACFVSMDSEAYYNRDAEFVDMNAWMDTENTSELFRIKKQLDADKTLPIRQEESVLFRSPDEEAIKQIRALLHPNAKTLSAKREAFVPDELNKLMTELIPYLEQNGTLVVKIENIQYGKKIKIKMGLKEAEINVFYGRKGYSVVISPRRGTNDELNTLMAQLIEQFICQ